MQFGGGENAFFQIFRCGIPDVPLQEVQLQHGPRNDLPVKKADDVAREAGGDDRSLADSVDTLREENRDDRGQGYERDVEADLYLSEILVERREA